MKKIKSSSIHLAWLVLSVIIGFTSVRGQALETIELARSIKASVVVLEADVILGKPSSTGTGFFVTKSGIIATNAHVVKGVDQLRARTKANDLIQIQSILAVDAQNDLALVQAEPGTYIALPLASSSDVEAGQPIVVLGNPLGLDFSLTEGIVSAVRGPNELNGTGPSAPHIQISAPISFGSSGSPVLSEAGEVVGIVTSGFVTAQNLNFATPSELLQKLITSSKTNPPKRELSSRKSVIYVAISIAFFVSLFLVFKYVVKD